MVAICKTIFLPLSLVSESHKTQCLWIVKSTSQFLHWAAISRKRTEISSLPRGFPWSLFVTVKCTLFNEHCSCSQWL